MMEKSSLPDDMHDTLPTPELEKLQFPEKPIQPPSPREAVPLVDFNEEGLKDPEISDMSDKPARMAFLRKVYGILAIQLLFPITAMCIAINVWFPYWRPLRFLVRSDISWIIPLMYYIIMMRFPDARRNFPANMIQFSIFTLLECFLTGAIVSYHGETELLITFIMIEAVAVGLVILSTQTKYEFTLWMTAFYVCAIVFVVFGIVGLIQQYIYESTLYCALAALLFALHLLYDTHLMTEGHYWFTLTPKEYFFAAFNLYLDVLNAAVHFLTLTGFIRWGPMGPIKTLDIPVKSLVSRCFHRT